MHLEGRFQQRCLGVSIKRNSLTTIPTTLCGWWWIGVGSRQPNTCSAAISCRMALSDCERNNVLTSQSRYSYSGIREGPCLPTKSWLKLNDVLMERGMTSGGLDRA